VNHIDTSDFTGRRDEPDHQKSAAPLSRGLVIVTKVGARRGQDKSWMPATSRQEIIDAVHDNLRNLSLEALDVVNYRTMGRIHGPGESPSRSRFPCWRNLKSKD